MILYVQCDSSESGWIARSNSVVLNNRTYLAMRSCYMERRVPHKILGIDISSKPDQVVSMFSVTILSSLQSTEEEKENFGY